MKILIGTPIHINNDRIVVEWLKSVSKLQYATDLLVVDSSPGLSYINKVNDYCKEFGIKNYKIEHLEINQENGVNERIGRSREVIRQYVLSHNYDAWFSWECDSLILSDTLDKLVEIVKFGKFDIVSNVKQVDFSINPKTEPNDNLNCSLIKKEALKKYGFLLDDPEMPNSWHRGGSWFKKRLIKDGGKYIEIRMNPDGTIPKQTKIKLDRGWKGSLLPFIDSSLHEIFIDNNLICYLSQEGWKNLKKELLRVLRIGGKLEVIFWDFDYILQSFLIASEKKRWAQWWPKIFGSQKNENDFYKNGFTYNRLVSELSEEGMVGFKRKMMLKPGYIHLVCYKYKQKQP